MKNTFLGPFHTPPRQLLRQAGYSEQRSKGTNEVGFVRRLTPASYPRFHAYIIADEHRATLNLHLDQKWASYESGHAHGGDYEGSLVEREMTRLTALFLSHQTRPVQETTPEQVVRPHQKTALPRLVQNHTTQTHKTTTPLSWWERLLSTLLR